ncbi:hypothetical protein PC117_g22490 [Phytophthora cactorum]|uniref:Uncharacterized protein n=1 Tax=Phytophthora cactorum TaxID=29920 RepID=A0A8T1BC43_9STRA|nr:hypothetical protein PC117_g22490 [Phytophthora cactorum]
MSIELWRSVSMDFIFGSHPMRKDARVSRCLSTVSTRWPISFRFRARSPLPIPRYTSSTLSSVITPCPNPSSLTATSVFTSKLFELL